MKIRALFFAVLSVCLLASFAQAARGSTKTCDDLLTRKGATSHVSSFFDLINDVFGEPDFTPSPRATRRTLAAKTFATAAVPSRPERLFSQLEKAIAAKEGKIRAILHRFNNHVGTEFEIQQVLRMLREATLVETAHLRNTRELNAVAVYASTNVPLYTLVSHGLIPALISKNVWFRTPEITRQVYVELFKELAGSIDADLSERLHVLTESTDVQYDNFRKKHVLGMNQRGVRIVKDPADLVIFTGSPETGRRVLKQNIDKMNELSQLFGERKVLFLGFGAGMNPVIVTPDAATNLQQVVRLLLEPVRMNCAQDCMVPDFYAVHESVAPALLKALVDEIRALKPGQSSDPAAGFSPLTYNTDWERLTAYRAEHAAHLWNPDATFDPNSKLVAPHVFAFSYEDFRRVELREHYAPFFAFFTYRSEQDLQTMARDERVQKKAMYASVYGGRTASPWISAASRIFRENRHSVTINTTLFGESEGSIPFGGRGSDASIIATLKLKPGAPVEVQMAHSPALVSEEAFFAFGSGDVAPLPSLHAQGHYQGLLAQKIEAATGNAPLGHLESLGEIAQLSAEKGLWQIIPGRRPQWTIDLQGLEEFYGTRLLFEDELQASHGKPVRVPGVLLHTSEVGQADRVLGLARGDLNPHLPQGELLKHFEDNKLAEYILVQAVWPGLMAKTEVVGSLAKSRIIRPEFFERRDALKTKLDGILRSGVLPNEIQRQHLERELVSWLKEFFDDVRKHYPEGAFFKNYGDFGTADMGTQITSFSSSPKAIIGQFLRRFEDVVASRASRRNLANSAEVILEDSWEMGTKFIYKLFTHPDDIMVQSRVKLARTELGFKKEYRVDILKGHPVHSKLRFTHEYDPEGCEEAEKIVAEFFKRAPESIRTLSGGIDIAQLAGGGWVIIELNAGSASGTMSPGYFPIESNALMSRIQGRPTRLIQSLEALFQLSVEERKAHLASMRVQKELWWKQSIGDLSAYEVAKWLRDRTLDRWRKGEDKRPAEQVIAEITDMLSVLDVSTREEAERLIEGSRFYIARKKNTEPK